TRAGRTTATPAGTTPATRPLTTTRPAVTRRSPRATGTASRCGMTPMSMAMATPGTGTATRTRTRARPGGMTSTTAASCPGSAGTPITGAPPAGPRRPAAHGRPAAGPAAWRKAQAQAQERHAPRRGVDRAHRAGAHPGRRRRGVLPLLAQLPAPAGLLGPGHGQHHGPDQVRRDRHRGRPATGEAGRG